MSVPLNSSSTVRAAATAAATAARVRVEPDPVEVGESACSAPASLSAAGPICGLENVLSGAGWPTGVNVSPSNE